MSSIIIEFTENGYLIEQRQSGYDWTGRWVAETEKSLLQIITERTREHWEKVIKEEGEKEGK